MRIETGLFPHMVMQRAGAGGSRQPLSGQARPGAAITLRATRSGRALPGWAAKRLGTADRRGRFAVALRGLPVGGPYDLRLGDGAQEVHIADVCVGDVWLLAGQSNMEGIGRIPEPQATHPLVRAFFMDERWGLAAEPLHQLAAARAPAHRRISPDITARPPGIGAGPSLPAGLALAGRDGIPQGLIPSAHAGTSLAQWTPARSTATLYGAAIDRVRRNGGACAGVLWYQGESECRLANLLVYRTAMRRLIRALRRDLGPVPVALVQIGRVCDLAWTAGQHGIWSGIRELQRRLPEEVPRLAVVPTVDLPLDDQIHIGGDGQQLLGGRLADAITHLRVRSAPAPALTPRRISTGTWRGDAIIDVHYPRGSALQADGAPSGFTLVIGGADAGAIFRTRCLGDRVRLHHNLDPEHLQEAELAYGWGLMPHCSLQAGDGRPLLAFGPWPLGSAPPTTGFCDAMLVSPARAWRGGIDGVRLPPPETSWLPAPRSQWFHPQPALQAETRKRLVYFRHRFDCPTRMRLALLLGYDGPVRVWFDGEPVFCDPDGQPPIGTRDARVPVRAAAGAHEVCIALGSTGTALGVSLRLARLGVATDAPPDKRLLPSPATSWH